MDQTLKESKAIKIVQGADEQNAESLPSKETKKNKYAKVSENTDNEGELNDNNDNDLEINVNPISPNNELTLQDIERLNKIKEEVLQRSERYEKEILGKNNKNRNTTHSEILNSMANTDSSNMEIFESNEDDMKNMKEINPNENRIFSDVQPYFFIREEPLFILGPNINHYIWIFSGCSFLSIIFYSLKKEKNKIMQIFFWIGYLLCATMYTLLMLLNPGIPKNKKDIDILTLRKNYTQCEICKCICDKNNKFTFHCNDCNICVENFDHHCSLASKCIGNNNKIIFKLWLISIPLFIIIIFIYLIM